MRIDTFSVTDLIGLRSSHIKSLQLTFTSNIQLILGTNGSGKSTLLRQLTPRPPSRNDYVDGGCREMSIVHRGEQYYLISDFSKKGSPHSFKQLVGEEWVERNDGGTSGVQEELVTKYLGYTKQVEAIVTGNIKFSTMTPSARESLIMETNPHNLGFMLAHSKKIASHIRRCKNNINHLQGRKVELETQLLDPSTVEELRKESDSLNSLMIDLIKWTSSLEAVLPQYTTSPEERVDIDTVVTTLKTLRRELVDTVDLYDPKGVGPDGLKRQQKLHEDLIRHKSRLESLETQLTEINGEIQEYEHQIKEHAESADYNELLLKEVAFEKELEALKPFILETPVPAHELADILHDMPYLKNILSVFLDCDTNLIPRKRYAVKQVNMERIGRSYQHYCDELEYYQQENVSLKKSLDIHLDDIPKGNCAGMACPLFSTFKPTFDRKKATYEQNARRIKQLERKLEKYSIYLEGQDLQLKKLHVYVSAVDQLQDFLGRHTCIRGVFKTPHLYTILRDNPLSFYNKAEEILSRSTKTHRYEDVKLEKAKLDIQKEHLTAKSQNGIGSIQDRLKSVLKKYQGLTRSHSREMVLYNKTYADYHLLTTKIKLLEDAQDYLKEVPGIIDTHRKHSAFWYLSDVIDRLKAKKQEVVDRLGSINNTLREQHTLRARYEEEVLANLKRIEQEKIEFELVGKALSDIPHKHTVNYLNTLLETMNLFIKKVFTYELILKPLKLSDNITWRFPLQIRDTVSADTTTCSAAQREIIDIAFCLALRHLLGLHDYPISMDEVGATFDTVHKRRLIDLLRYVMDSHMASEMFLVNHHALVHDGLSGCQVLVLNDENIVTPGQAYNEHAIIEKG